MKYEKFTTAEGKGIISPGQTDPNVSGFNLVGAIIYRMPISMSCCCPGLPDFSLIQHTKMGGNIPNDRKISRMATKYTYQPLPLQDPPKFTQIGIFGLKICIASGNPAAAEEN
jgi:hypothetical protein